MCHRHGKLAPRREGWGLFCSRLQLNNRREALPAQAQHDARARASAPGCECSGAAAPARSHLRGNCQVTIFRALLILECRIEQITGSERLKSP